MQVGQFQVFALAVLFGRCARNLDAGPAEAVVHQAAAVEAPRAGAAVAVWLADHVQRYGQPGMAVRLGVGACRRSGVGFGHRRARRGRAGRTPGQAGERQQCNQQARAVPVFQDRIHCMLRAR